MKIQLAAAASSLLRVAASSNLSFGRGLSTDDEPALWRKELTGEIALWIEVGLPDEKLIRRACGRSRQVVVLTYSGRTADMWWQQNQGALQKLRNLVVLNLAADEAKALAAMATRSMKLQCTVQEGELWFIVDGVSTRIAPERRLEGQAS